MGRCILKGRECGSAVEADEPQTGGDIFVAFDGLLWRRPMGCRKASQGRVNLGKTVCGTTCGPWFAVREHGNAGCMMRMIGEEYWNENRRIEKVSHLSVARAPRGRVRAGSSQLCS